MQSDVVTLWNDEGLKLTAHLRIWLNRLLEEHAAMFAENSLATENLHCIASRVS